MKKLLLLCAPLALLGSVIHLHAATVSAPSPGKAAADSGAFSGRFYHGRGDADYLRLLETAASLFEPNPSLPHLAMLYMPAWNGLVEGPTWDAWWIQNSYGTTFAVLPFLREPFITFLQNSQDLWFDQMGDGRRTGAGPPFNWVAPDGALCDAARPGYIIYKQGDGRTAIHDWGLEFTAAGMVMQAELLLISRDATAVAKYLPRLERCANFIETRRDPANNLFLAGPAGNLLAPSYAGWKKPDGSYGMAYLAGLSVTYIAALDRLIELEHMAARPDQARLFSRHRDDAKQGLAQLLTSEGYFIRSLDPDGTRHGVYGAPRHGYFEASPNHDAIALRVVDDAQAERIYRKLASIPGLRPHHFILPNFPSYDDMYEKPEGLWGFGTWVNGGHWSTCEARMILAYYRVGAFEDARRSMRQLLTFAERFRMDNPLVKFGSDVYQPDRPINLTYDAFGPPAAFVRGLFEYQYTVAGLRVFPHIPASIRQLEQRLPVRFGAARLYLATAGRGAITAVRVNGKSWTEHDAKSLLLPASVATGRLQVALGLGGTEPPVFGEAAAREPLRIPSTNDSFWDCSGVCDSQFGNQLALRIGADPFGGNAFVGAIRCARLYRRALSGDEVVRLATSPEARLPGEPSLVADYGPAGLGGKTVTNTAGPRLVASRGGDLRAGTDTGHPAFIFSGRGHLEVAPDRDLDLRENYTLEAWIRPGPLSDRGGRIIDRCTPGTSDGFMMDYGYQGQLRFICEAGTVAAPVSLETSRWHHVAATIDQQNQLQLYLDGKVVGRGQGGGRLSDSSRHLLARVGAFHRKLEEANLAESYESEHARLVVDCVAVAHERAGLKSAGRLSQLPAVSQAAADRAYVETAERLAQGLARALTAYTNAADARQRRILEIWQNCP